MTIDCKVVFDHNVAYSGQILSGTVHLTTTDAKIVHGVKIRIKGGTRVVVRIGNMIYTLKQYNLEHEMYVAGSSDGRIQLTAGLHCFRFEYILPMDLPSTVYGEEIGEITEAFTSYEIRVVVNKLYWMDKEFINPFTVIRPRYLCLGDTLLLPLEVEVSKRFAMNCLLFWNTSDPLKTFARIPVRGYYPGETINLKLNVTNRSHVTVTKFTVKLKRQLSCFYKKKMTHCVEQVTTISKHKTRGCNNNDDANIQVNVKVPLTIIPTDTSTCTIIQIRYFIEIVGHVGSWHSKQMLRVPIEVGTVPPNVDCI